LSVVAQFRLLRAAKQAADVTVLLSGQGGDEVLLGYLKFFFFHLRELLQHSHFGRAARELAGSLAAGTVLHQFTLREARRYVAGGIGKNGNGAKIAADLVPIWRCANLRSRQVSDIEFYSIPALTHYEDRNAAAHSLEVRHPFLDHRLVEFLLGLPTKLKIRNGWTKYVLRRSLSELPDVIRWRRDKQPFLTPEELWLKRDLQPVLRNLCKHNMLEKIGVLNTKEFANHYEAFLRGRAISASEISRVLIAEVWSQEFFN
jgi:asparagine synthase (glutamine-hydrolysing)